MPINLANVNISLQQFQKISSGTYNAGEVKLASENKLAKMNNHVDRTSQNGETISHAEVIAIKQSLVRALQQHGVGQEEIARIATEALAGKEMIGPDDRDGIREVVSIALLRGRPGLARLLDEFFARPEVKADVEELQYDETSDVFSVGNFLICSSDPDINPSGEEQAEQVRILFTEPRERSR